MKFDPNQMDKPFCFVYLTKNKRAPKVKPYKTLKSVQTQKQNNLFEKILDDAEKNNLPKEELIKRIREGLSQCEDVVGKLNQLSNTKKSKLEQVLLHILEQDN